MVRLLRLWRTMRADLRFLWRALHHPQRPRWLWPVTVLLAIFALEPANFALPVLGMVDDLLLLPVLLHGMLMLLPAGLRAGTEARHPDDRFFLPR